MFHLQRQSRALRHRFKLSPGWADAQAEKLMSSSTHTTGTASLADGRGLAAMVPPPTF